MAHNVFKMLTGALGLLNLKKRPAGRMGEVYEYYLPPNQKGRPTFKTTSFPSFISIKKGQLRIASERQIDCGLNSSATYISLCQASLPRRRRWRIRTAELVDLGPQYYHGFTDTLPPRSLLLHPTG